MKVYIYLVMLLLLIGLVSASTNLDFDIDVKDPLFGGESYDASGEQGEYVYMDVKIENVGDTDGTKRVECGIYRADTIKEWHPLSIFSIVSGVAPVDNCVSDEAFVDTYSASLNAGDSKTAEFKVRVPNYEVGTDYVWHCSAYDSCWNQVKDTTQDIGESDWFTRRFQILDGGQFSVECKFNGDCRSLYGDDYQCFSGECKYVAPVVDEGDGDGTTTTTTTGHTIVEGFTGGEVAFLIGGVLVIVLSIVFFMMLRRRR